MPYAREYIRTFIKVHHSEEHFVGMVLRVTEGIGHNHKLVMSVSENEKIYLKNVSEPDKDANKFTCK
jgi:hypothetical protein